MAQEAKENNRRQWILQISADQLRRVGVTDTHHLSKKIVFPIWNYRKTTLAVQIQSKSTQNQCGASETDALVLGGSAAGRSSYIASARFCLIINTRHARCETPHQ